MPTVPIGADPLCDVRKAAAPTRARRSRWWADDPV